ncbi:MAG: hypothetical protein ABWX92_16960, partial [Mycetocola sp.]
MSGVLTGFGVIGAIIAIGYIVGRSGLLGQHAQPVIARTVFFVLSPFLLFTVLADAEVERLFSPLIVVSLLAALVAFAVFLFVAVGLGILLSVSALMLEEMSFHMYPKGQHIFWLGLAVVLENFGYRQINSWWRLIGLYRWARNSESSWGTMTR